MRDSASELDSYVLRKSSPFTAMLAIFRNVHRRSARPKAYFADLNFVPARFCASRIPAVHSGVRFRVRRGQEVELGTARDLRRANIGVADEGVRLHVVDPHTNHCFGGSQTPSP